MKKSVAAILGKRSGHANGPGRGNWILFGVLVLALAVAPMLLNQFSIGLLAKFLCYSMVAIGLGLLWGRGGVLSLGQGVFFGLGGYIMAMHMKLADATLNGGNGVPDFMSLYGDGQVPWWWAPFRSSAVTLVAIPVVPALVAWALGAAIFKRRVKGAYFSILSQALVAAFALLLIGAQTTTGGSNGLSDFTGFFGYVLNDPANQRTLYYLVLIVVLVMLLVTGLLMYSRFGEVLVAVRDTEERVRFLGYDPANIKTGAFVFAAVLAGIGGALFVPVAGIISPSDVGVTPSIIFLLGVALGGRSTFLGPVLGSLIVSIAQNSLSNAFPSFWSYLEGGLFIAVIALLPGGVASVGSMLRRRRHRDAGGPAPDASDTSGEPETGSSAGTRELVTR